MARLWFQSQLSAKLWFHRLGEKRPRSGEIPTVWGLKRQNYVSNAAKVWVKLHPRR